MSNKELKANFVVYCHTSPSGNKYIGITNNYEKRCYSHTYKSSNCRLFSRAIKKYGWDNFKHEILAIGLTLHAANHFEQFYIKHFNSLSPNGYNLRSGGDSSIPCEETKRKISESNKGEKSHMYGKKHTLERRKQISESKKGEKHHFFGKNHTQETRNKISKSMSGGNSPNFGKFGEDNHRSKKYIITRPDGIIEIIIGLAKYCRENRLNDRCMSRVASGTLAHHKKYKCKHY